MTQSTNELLTPSEIKWFSDVKLSQCNVTFRNSEDIVQFVIQRCFSPEFYTMLKENLIPKLTDAPIFDASQTYGTSQVVRVVLNDEPWQRYYELTQASTPPHPNPEDGLPWTELTDYTFAGVQIPAWNNSTTYKKGERVNYNGMYYEATAANTATHPTNTTAWKRMPKFYDPNIEEFFCEYLAHWLAYNVWFHKVPFIRGQQEDATIQFRFVDYQIAQESIQSLRQGIQNHLFMIWTNMKMRFPSYFENHEQYDNGCQDPTGVDCGDEARRKYLYRVA